MLERVLREGTLDASEKKLIARLADTSRTARAEAERALLKKQADEIEALDSIYTGYFDKLTDAPPFKVSPGRMRPRSADDGVRSPQSSRARKHAITARRFSRVSRAARLHTCETAETRCERCGTVWEYENNKVNRQAGWSVIG